LQGLRERYGAAISVAPFEEPETQVVLAECYPGLFADMIAARTREGEIPDRAQVRILAHALPGWPGPADPLLREGDRTEGWILGHGAEAEIAAALP
jgi:molybdopterin molybdotransferase